MKKKLFFITLSYPYSIGKEESFIENELNVLANNFDKIVICPTIIGGELYDLPTNCIHSTNYANYLNKIKNTKKVSIIISGLFSNLFVSEFINHYKDYNTLKKVLKLILYTGNLRKRIKWFNINFEHFNFNIIYTFWFTIDTKALSLSKVGKRNKIITRVHGVDLYNERNITNSFFREKALKNIALVANISNKGRDYLIRKHPKFKHVFKTYYLCIKNNVSKSNILNSCNQNNKLFVVSCSSVIKIKRVHKIYEALKLLSKSKQINVHWTHIGDGELFDKLKSYSKPGKFLKINLVGNLKNKDVHYYYRNNRVDVFLHLSETEGLPVVMMEAASYGIPIISTDVGGVSEIVLDGQNGFLLPENPYNEVIANKLFEFYQLSKQEKQQFRNKSREHWYMNFNADVCFDNFYKKIDSL